MSANCFWGIRSIDPYWGFAPGPQTEMRPQTHWAIVSQIKVPGVATARYAS